MPGDESPSPGTLLCRAVDDSEYERFLEIDEEYLDGDRKKLTGWREKRPGWFRGAFLDGELVGVCYGREDTPGEVTLHGIAVLYEHWRGGIGTVLIRDFEDTLRADGMHRVGLGSAEDVPTESFYLKNGYQVDSVMLNVPRGSKPVTDTMLPDGVVEVEGRHADRSYFVGTGYDRDLRDSLKAMYGTDGGNFIFVKLLTPLDAPPQGDHDRR